MSMKMLMLSGYRCMTICIDRCYLPATGLADVPLLVLAVQVELARRQDHFQIGCPRHHDLSEDDVVALAWCHSPQEALRVEKSD